jgi:superfamily II DNA/RNA helicase
MEFDWIITNEKFMNWMLDLVDMHTKQGMNFLLIFKNRQPVFNIFELAAQRGMKCHMIFGGTPNDVRNGIKAQIENETGWLLVATDGTMSMGVSINNLHAMGVALLGHSPHVTLQAIGRMLRNHPNKLDTTICYDINNDTSGFATSFAKNNTAERFKYYHSEKYPILPVIHRTI